MKISNNLHIKNKIYFNQFSKRVCKNLRKIFWIPFHKSYSSV